MLVSSSTVINEQHSLIHLGKDTQGWMYFLVDGETVYKVKGKLAMVFCLKEQWDVLKEMITSGRTAREADLFSRN